MATYSTDQDLVPVYFPAADALPDGLAPLHEEAGAQIGRDLIAAGIDEDSLPDLTAASLLALVKPACCYVMYLIYRAGLAHDRDGQVLGKVKFWHGEYSAAVSAARVSVDATATEDPAPAGNNRVWLG